MREHARSAGVGRRIVESIVANQPDTVQIIDMIPQSREFWRKLGIENETSRSDDFIQNGELNWDSLRRADRQGTPAPAARESDTDSRRAESAGILGETPRGEGATEEQLSDEEFARLFPDRPKYSRLGQRTEGIQDQRLVERQQRIKEVQDQLSGLGDRLSDDADGAESLVPNKANYSLRPYSGNELELDFVGPLRPLSRQQLDMLTSHPDAHSTVRHGGAVTDPQLMDRSLTGVAPDGHVKIDKKSGKVMLPPMSSAFHSDRLMAYADDVVRNNGVLASKTAQNPGDDLVTLYPADVGDLGLNLGRGYARLGSSKLNPSLEGAPQLIDNLRSVQATYGSNPLTNRWEPVTIFPAR
ncbi:hypothetical protein [Andreprevotia sp. IGB-42]|uniref:hypothetical protein n=1 Tax=Andreprevotia sp. IGB-42 TaxID=2497473 RepID=UPI00135C9F0C|nr:hypothetical protein [Andreprevotia sp. IGB-42]